MFFCGGRFEFRVITSVQLSTFWETGSKFLQPGDDTVFYKQWFCSNMMSPLRNMGVNMPTIAIPVVIEPRSA